MGPFFNAEASAINRLLVCRDWIRRLICSDLGRRSIKRQAAIDMTDHKRESHQHHRSGNATQKETHKSQSRTIRHFDALMSYLS